MRKVDCPPCCPLQRTRIVSPPHILYSTLQHSTAALQSTALKQFYSLQPLHHPSGMRAGTTRTRAETSLRSPRARGDLEPASTPLRRRVHSLLESAEGSCRDIKRTESAESAETSTEIVYRGALHSHTHTGRVASRRLDLRGRCDSLVNC